MCNSQKDIIYIHSLFLQFSIKIGLSWFTLPCISTGDSCWTSRLSHLILALRCVIIKYSQNCYTCYWKQRIHPTMRQSRMAIIPRLYVTLLDYSGTTIISSLVHLARDLFSHRDAASLRLSSSYLHVLIRFQIKSCGPSAYRTGKKISENIPQEDMLI